MSIVKQSLVGASGQGGDYTIDDSLRFRSSASAYLNRTPATAGNRKTWTLSWWAKRGALGSTGFTVFSAGSAGGSGDTSELVIKYDNNYPDSLAIQTLSTNVRFTNALYRDPSAWHHVVVAFDTTQATASNRTKVYVNGEQITSFNLSNDLAQNTDTAVNNTVTQEIGVFARINTQYFDGYLTEVQMIDGQQLTADDFGEFDDNGTWKAKEYEGTYGTNGFYLPFRNPTVGTVSADYLVVAGGGSGGSSYAGGGGAGGYLTGSSLTLNTTTGYAVTVGAGGASVASGSDSVFSSITSTGGGNGNAANGGSGGGGNNSQTSAGGSGNTPSTVPSQGNDGGAGFSSGAGSGGGGGGGAGSAGNAAVNLASGAGGAGTASSITGSSITRAGGGGGGAYSGTAGAGGTGGGGAGGRYSSSTGGTNGTANTGGGGGGGTVSHSSGNGGSGVVIISYSGVQQFSGGTITSSGGNTIHTFTTSGFLTPVFNDFSGNDNNWTGNNFNVSDSTATTYDLMKDTPSLVDENAGNFCTWNPLGTPVATYTITLSEGNLKASYYVPTNNARIIGTLGVSSGKWYFEFQATAGSPMVGFATTDGSAGYVYDGNAARKRIYAPISGGQTSALYGATWNTTNTIGVALDLDAGTLTFYKDNVSQGVAYTGLSGTFTPTTGYQGGTTVTGLANFGQRPFEYTPPTGFLKLNTFNLPDSTIEDGSDYFNTVLYTGNGSTQSITGVNFQPDFVWIKNRSSVYSHQLFDTVRGASKRVYSDAANVEDTDTNSLSSFNTDGFSVGTNVGVNQSSAAQVAWNWKANGSGVSNTVGTVPSTVSANTTSGFSVVGYTGVGSTGTVGHGLGVAPKLILTKTRSIVNAWNCYHASLGAGYRIFLDTTGTPVASSTVWNNTSPTSTVFSVGDANTNGSGTTMIAYCFAEVEGYSAFSSYTGNGSTDGPFVYTGFRPRYLIIKRTNVADAWAIKDTARDTYNVDDSVLKTNENAAESTSTFWNIDILSNGFKLRNLGSTFNNSGGTYLYMAFAENPFKNALAR